MELVRNHIFSRAGVSLYDVLLQDLKERCYRITLKNGGHTIRLIKDRDAKKTNIDQN